MLNFNVNVGKKLLVCGGESLSTNMFRSTFWMAMCIFLQKCEVERVILNLVAFKKYPNSIWFWYMVQLRLDNCTLVGRQLVICDAMFGFWLGDGFNPDYFFIDKINYTVSIENHRPTLKDSFFKLYTAVRSHTKKTN